MNTGAYDIFPMSPTAEAERERRRKAAVSGRNQGAKAYPFHKLEVGQSFVVPADREPVARLRQYVRAVNWATSNQYALFTHPDFFEVARLR